VSICSDFYIDILCYVLVAIGLFLQLPNMDEKSLNAHSDNSSLASTIMPSSITEKPPEPDFDADTERYGSDYPAPSLHAPSSIEANQPSTTGNALTITISHTLSRIRTKDSGIDPGPPPDGGIKAWTQAVLVHLVIFNTWGYVNSFGLFQTYYTTILLPSHNSHPSSPSAVSWIGSIQIFLLFFIGTFSGRATDAGFFKLSFISGSILQLIGIFTTSVCTKYWQLFLAQGVCTGLGNGLVFVPSVSLASVYFLKNRSLAIGLCASGSATGGLVFPAMAERLLPRVGFGWTVRAMGFVMLSTMILCAVFLKPRLPPRKSGPIVEWTAFKEKPYALFSVGMFLVFWGIYVGFYFVGSFGKDELGVSQSTAINLLLTMNGVGLPGRLIPNYYADKDIGPLNAIIPFAAISCLLLYAWIAVNSVTGLWIFAVVYGMFAAGIQSLFPATLTSLTDDPKRAGVRMGMVFSVVSFAVLTGPPIAGALISRGNGKYTYAQIFAGTSMVAGFAGLCAARVAKAGTKLKVKV
jgi:MFS family permease